MARFSIPFSGKQRRACLLAALAASRCVRHDANYQRGRRHVAACPAGRISMSRTIRGAAASLFMLASALMLSAGAAHAQSKPPLKIGGILDMSSLYADITGVGSETAAKMAVEDFGGEVLGRKIEV